MMMLFVAAILFVFTGSSDKVFASSDCQKIKSQIQSFSPLKSISKPTMGVINGIIYNPPSSSAIVDGIIVHPGDTIHNAIVLSINQNTVQFAKNNITWSQNVLDTPNPAWLQ